MIVTKTLKFRLYRSKQAKSINQQIDISGIIYNHCISLHKRYYAQYGRHLSKYLLQKHIARLKKRSEYAFWKLVDAQAIQNIVERIQAGYELFFENLKRDIKTNPPKFKKVKRYKSFTLKQTSWKLLEGNKIKLRGKVYKFVKHREIEGKIKTVTVKRDNLGNLWLCLAVKQEIEPSESTTGKSAGFDFSLKTFLVSSDGEVIQSPEFLKRHSNQLAKAQRILSRKAKGSKAWNRARLNVARIHKRITDKRRDWFFKLAHQLTDEYDYLFFETLNLKGMQRIWGRKVSDLAFSDFLLILRWVAKLKGKVVHFIDRWFPSTKTCSCCGYINRNLTLNDRWWRCPDCQVVHDRDSNAAVNIWTEGIQSLGLGDVRRSLASAALHEALEAHAL